VVPTINRFHWNYMDGDFWAETNLGPWNTDRQLRYGGAHIGARSDMRQAFHDVLEFIWCHTIEPELYMSIPEYAHHVMNQKAIPPGKITPLDVAAGLAKYGVEATRQAAQARGLATGNRGDHECALLDAEASGYLGLYYAWKIRGSFNALMFIKTQDESYQRKAFDNLFKARDAWHRLVAINKDHYIEHQVLYFNEFSWDMYNSHVDADILKVWQFGCPPGRSPAASPPPGLPDLEKLRLAEEY
jgi:hypothetical protein